MNGPGLAPPQNSRPGRTMVIATRAVVIVLTVCSLGILCWVPMLRLAIVRRRGQDWARFWGVLVLSLYLISFFRTSLADTVWPNVAIIVLLAMGGLTLTSYVWGDIKHQKDLAAQLVPAFPQAPAPAGPYDAYAAHAYPADARSYGQPGPPPAPDLRDARSAHAAQSFAETQPFRAPFPAQPSQPQPPSRPRPPHLQPQTQQPHLQQPPSRTSPFPPSHPQSPHAPQVPPTPSYGYIPQPPPAPAPPVSTPPPWPGAQAQAPGQPQPQAPGRHRRPQAATPYQPQRLDEVRAELDELSDLLRREPRDRRERGL
ncbi:hypothetical protein [Streptomyces albireticuli]|nr:hypothetical protein [Streptomyces albireticuli]MCD9144525.1 hypothetical protein [Streptomyces albireticuli]MCD9163412.1 hypothetical protein [Streptomyces albireticuli]MCD9193202.1 hypothetical protein [Streptomyces albireticuli]